MRIAFFTTVLPGGRRGGGEIVTHSVVDALLKAGHEVRVFGYRRSVDHGAECPGEVCVGHRPIETSSAGVRSLGWMIRALAGRSAYSVAKYSSRSYDRAARGALHDGAGVVIVDHAQAHSALPSAGELGAPLIFIAHNAESDSYTRLAAAARRWTTRWVNRREARLIRGVETQLARRATQVWALSDDDADYFRSIAPGADVRTLEVASAVAEPVAAGLPACDVALIGTWTWRANATGLEWFSDEVVPHLPPELTIEVAGAGAEWLQGRHPNVTVKGVVPDAQRFLSKARAIAVPAVAGGGVQVKVLDAIASGVPVVATSVAVRGLADVPASVAVADTGAAFAESLRRFVFDTDHASARRDALAWSRTRRERLEAGIWRSIGELTDQSRAEQPRIPAETQESRAWQG